MSSSNDKFKKIMSDAETAIKSKIEILINEDHASQTEIDPVIIFTRQTAEPFYSPKLYLIEFDFDEAMIHRELVVFSSTRVETANDLKIRVIRLAEVINKAGLEKAITKAESLVDSVINERILSEETLARRKITGASGRLFPTEGLTPTELRQDTELMRFLRLRKAHKPVRQKYRQALKDEALIGVEGDLMLIRSYRKFFATVNHKKEFVDTYADYAQFFKKQVAKLQEKPA